jgi:hypothetical protein
MHAQHNEQGARPFHDIKVLGGGRFNIQTILKNKNHVYGQYYECMMIITLSEEFGVF